MKNLASILLACFAFTACQQPSDGYRIDGKADGFADGTVYLKSFRNKMFTTVDSVPLTGGRFRFTGKVETPQLYAIATDGMSRPLQLFIENAPMEVSLQGGGEKIEIKNSPLNDLFLQNQEAVTEEGYNIDSLVSLYPASPVSAFFLYRYFTYQLPLEQLKAVRAKLAPELDGLVYVTDLDTIIGTLEKVQIGCPAPGFTLPDTEGNAVSLASFKGKYVLLDFWASWCPYCRKENPNLVAAYEKFNDKNFTVLGISLDNRKEPWLKAIAHDRLEWTNVSDLQYWDAAVPALYGIRGIPANVLVNPDGIIVAKGLKGQALHEKLEELLR
ncbi:MAG: AhpC/TSA family protein [Parabacteroides sp.]|nr:AhpC/TSA family protein [Parabacteroides sp.]